MHIDPQLTSHQDNYKLLTNIVVPRPIAWVTSQNSEGIVNLAPFSFFNAIGSDPLYIIISIGRKDNGSMKDTANNIIENGEFAVNLVTEDLINAMNISAANFPSGESELTAVGLHATKSKRIKVPIVTESQASLECVLHSQQPLGAYTLFIGQVVMFHVDDNLLSDRLHISGFAPIGRMGSPAYYCRTSERFEAPRISYENWQSEHANYVPLANA
ncbi:MULTISPECIES: flavin reductase family protein [Pseudanabaena]|uniref:Flavin reductase domain protein FMN-binding n=2 Tax=Pseudanabaena TaxID=1152 RepID=L8MW87_9CYAN|nr:MULTISPECIES: flavin reductase family protein [Pseudanabaena]ELS31084.1 flavin reductase domain protein FMN-binding [Pseudanabaena biceps PCC 7429]MDG3496651.1 flavin reductase family protein [Pseudanabaena catenata USMAC16]